MANNHNNIAPNHQVESKDSHNALELKELLVKSQDPHKRKDSSSEESDSSSSEEETSSEEELKRDNVMELQEFPVKIEEESHSSETDSSSSETPSDERSN